MCVRPIAAALLLACVLIGGCGPSGPRVPRSKALVWHDVLTVHVQKVWDLMKWHVETDPHVTHLVAVRILHGPSDQIGDEMLLPYDAHACGTESEPRKPPPSAGSQVTIMPSQWVIADTARRRYRRRF
ncbi:MAG: hypothetical protein ACOCVS_03055 [Planctomycetota bacterium]